MLARLTGKCVFAYWFLFALFALPALSERNRLPDDHRTGLALGAIGLFMALMIGLRFQVGADFSTYEFIFRRAADSDLFKALDRGDPGYQFINWAVGTLGGEMWQVNLICAAIFAWGLVRLCRQEPSPVLAALVAIPYLVVVVAMGYTRQGIAIGLIMAGIAALSRGGSVIRFAMYVALAALFHRTAVLVLPIAIFAGRRNHFLNILAIAAIAFGLYSALLADSVDSLVENYVATRYMSQGAGIRVAMNIVPALLVLLAGRRLGFTDYQLRLWRMFAIVSIVMVPALFLVPSTTAIDRIALYLLPIQIVAIGRSLSLFSSAAVGRLAIVAYCFMILFVWMNFAAHSRYWVPYRVTPIWG